jgi:hypothetical protein
MATWTSISNAAVAVGGIPSSVTVTALRDNPEAIAEAATGAPVIFAGWHPVDKLTIGDGKTGLIYDHGVNGTVADIVTPDFVDGYEYRIVAHDMSHNSGSNRSLRLELFVSSYSTAFTLTAQGGLFDLAWFDAEILMPRMENFIHFVRYIARTTALEADTAGAVGSNGKVTKARLIFSAGSIDGGKVWLFRRREYASAP